MCAIAYDSGQAVFWSDFVDLAYATFNADEPNPKPPQFPANWVFNGNLQIYLDWLETTYFIGWIATENQTAETAVVYLGTEDLEWLYDADVATAVNPIGGRVEAGMYDMYKSLKIAWPGQSGTRPFHEFLEQLDVKHPVHVTGHSLGGALTTFTAAEIASLHSSLPSENLLVYSLASPRVGDAKFAAAFNSLVPHNYRIYNIRDYVPTLPPEFLGYVHVQQPEPVPPLDSWKYPVYCGCDPVKTIECYHSHLVYNYMLKVRNGQQPKPQEMCSCYDAREAPERVTIRRETCGEEHS